MDIPLDAIVTLLVFSIGVPTLVIQFLAPELRRVVKKRWPRLALDAGVPLTFGLVAVAVGIGVELAAPPPPRTLWLAVLAVLLTAAVFTAVWLPARYGRREAIVARLERAAAGGCRTVARLDERQLADLVELGEQSAAGQDKEAVLAGLLRLTERVCDHPRYRGDSLEDLILGVVSILSSPETPRSSTNFQTAADVLQRIVIASSGAERAGSRDVDLRIAISALSALGRAALHLENEHTPMSFVQALGSTGKRHPQTATAVSQALFEVGAVAISRGQTLVAVAALEKVFSLVEQRGSVAGELAADLLGLMAHFWSAGPTARGCVVDRLGRTAALLEEPLLSACDRARQHSAETMQFGTADRLRLMREELAAMGR